MTTPADMTGSPERRVWAAAEASGVRAGKRGPDRMARPDAIGGATAPLPVGAISTPPAQRRRMRDWSSTAPDMAGQMQELVDRVKDEFSKVWVAIQKGEDHAFDFIDQGTLDNLQISYDRRLTRYDMNITEVHNKLTEVDKAQGEIKANLEKFESELLKWTAGSDATTRALAEVQAMAARHQDSLGQSDELIKKVV